MVDSAGAITDIVLPASATVATPGNLLNSVNWGTAPLFNVVTDATGLGRSWRGWQFVCEARRGPNLFNT